MDFARLNRPPYRTRRPDYQAPTKRHSGTDAPLTFDGLDAAVERAREKFADTPDFIAKLERRVRERALVYKTLLTTGLRKRELASVRLRRLDLEAERAVLTLDAQSEKNRQGNSIPLRGDLADDLRSWLADRATVRRNAAQNAPTIQFDRAMGRAKRGTQNEADAGKLSPDELLFDVPFKLSKILDRDFQAAGIPKSNDRGRTLDVHALRTTFGTHLSMAGVPLRTAQAAMRHSTPTLTANIYTDPRLLDVHGAVESLPELKLNGTASKNSEAVRATGTFGATGLQLAPLLAPSLANLGQAESFAVTSPTLSEGDDRAGAIVAKLYPANENASPKRAEGGGRKARKSKDKTAQASAPVEPSTDFAQQVAGIFALPLTDSEKADCIRRLLATQSRKD